MPKVREDQHGLFVSAGGHKARPIKPTIFGKGDTVKTHHYGGSCEAGVGKTPDCKRGQYVEAWLTTGMCSGDKMDAEKEKLQISWYKVRASNPLSGVVITDQDRANCLEYEKRYF
jgi:hypothetical protein